MQNNPIASAGEIRRNTTLEVRQLELTGTRLRFEYKLKNGSGRVLYAFATLYRETPEGAQQPDANLVYTALNETSDVLEISKALLPVPAWAMVEAPEVPFLAMVDKGNEYRETIELPLPVRIHDPYEDDYPEGYHPEKVNTRAWRFTLGVVERDGGLESLEGMHSGTRTLFSISYQVAWRRQVLLYSQPVAAAIPVLVPAHAREQTVFEPPL